MTATRSGTALGARATTHAAEGRASRPITNPKEVLVSVAPFEMPLADLLSQVAEGGECRNDPDLHTGPDVFEEEPTAERLARQDVARAVCEECPVWALCLDYALRTRPTHGVWAGHLPDELAALRRDARRLPEVA